MEKLVIIKTIQQLDKLIDYVGDKDFIAFDTETDGVSVDSHVIGFSVCADVEVGYYVILKRWDVELNRLVDLETQHHAKRLLEKLLGKNLIMQNAPFDCSMVFRNFGIELMPSVHTDTMILGHLLNENRPNGLKERGIELFGENATKEQKLMKESVEANGGLLTKKQFELYKADADLIAHYGAKDAILTLKLFYHDVEQLYEQGLDGFFYTEESMPLLKGPTYDLNTAGLKVDIRRLTALKAELEAECLEAKAFIYKEIEPYIKDKYPGTTAKNAFNIDACQQRSWLLFERLENDFHVLTQAGKDMCKALGIKTPYTKADKQAFTQICKAQKGNIWQEAAFSYKTGKVGRPKKVGDSWTYMACGKDTLKKLSDKYKWVAKYLEYAKNKKILDTYVVGILERANYGIIRPSFLQHGTTSGRYSSRNPNFQNLPRDDKRVKACIISRPNTVFVGADYSQLEPRVFASFSNDERLLKCFENGDDFYSVIGIEVFEKTGCNVKKEHENSFAKKYPELRNIAKVVGLSATYGTTAPKMAIALGKSIEEAQSIIDNYFSKFPSVHDFMLTCHETAKLTGKVTNLFGRPRRMPEALDIMKLYGDASHGELPYEARNVLNLAVNHTIQSTAASIMNRAAIACYELCKALEEQNPKWAQVKIVLQVHDELVLEGPEELAEDMSIVLKHVMENTVQLPGVKLIAEPKIANNLADLK